MYEHIAECCVFLAGPRNIIERVSLRVAELCVSTVDSGTEKIFRFIDGEAIVSAVDTGILMHVGATDVVSYYGIRTALEGSILEAAAFPPEGLAWHPAVKCDLQPPTEKLAPAQTCSERAAGRSAAVISLLTGREGRVHPTCKKFQETSR